MMRSAPASDALLVANAGARPTAQTQNDAPAAQMLADDSAAVARAWAQAAWNQHDLDTAATFLAPDWVGHYGGLGDAYGLEGFKRVASSFLEAFPDMQITVEDALAVGDKLVRRVSWTATHQGTFLGVAATGTQVTVREVIMLRLADGRIAEEWAMADLLGLLQQLGAVSEFALDGVRAVGEEEEESR